MAYKTINKEVRSAVVTKLKATGAVTSLVPAANIYNFCISRLDAEDLPAINVLTLDDSDTSGNNDRYKRGVVKIVVECLTTDSADAVDDICEVVEEALISEVYTAQTWLNISAVGFVKATGSNTYVDPEGISPKIARALVFDVEYTREKATTTTVTDLETIGYDHVYEDGVTDSQINQSGEISYE